MVTITTIRVTDNFRAAALRIAVRNKQIVDVVDEAGDTIRGHVLAVHNIKGEARWIAIMEVACHDRNGAALPGLPLQKRKRYHG